MAALAKLQQRSILYKDFESLLFLWLYKWRKIDMEESIIFWHPCYLVQQKDIFTVVMAMVRNPKKHCPQVVCDR